MLKVLCKKVYVLFTCTRKLLEKDAQGTLKMILDIFIKITTLDTCLEIDVQFNFDAVDYLLPKLNFSRSFGIRIPLKEWAANSVFKHLFLLFLFPRLYQRQKLAPVLRYSLMILCLSGCPKNIQNVFIKYH